VAFAAKDASADFRLEWYLVMLAAVIADDLESFWRVLAGGGLFRTAFLTPLRRHHVPLVEHLLFLLAKDKWLFALNAY